MDIIPSSCQKCFIHYIMSILTRSDTAQYYYPSVIFELYHCHCCVVCIVTLLQHIIFCILYSTSYLHCDYSFNHHIIFGYL